VLYGRRDLLRGYDCGLHPTEDTASASSPLCRDCRRRHLTTNAHRRHGSNTWSGAMASLSLCPVVTNDAVLDVMGAPPRSALRRRTRPRASMDRQMGPAFHHRPSIPSELKKRRNGSRLRRSSQAAWPGSTSRKSKKARRLSWAERTTIHPPGTGIFLKNSPALCPSPRPRTRRVEGFGANVLSTGRSSRRKVAVRVNLGKPNASPPQKADRSCANIIRTQTSPRHRKVMPRSSVVTPQPKATVDTRDNPLSRDLP